MREVLGLQPGDPLAMAVDGDRLVLRKITLDDLLQESKRNYEEGKTLSHEETFANLAYLLSLSRYVDASLRPSYFSSESPISSEIPDRSSSGQ